MQAKCDLLSHIIILAPTNYSIGQIPVELWEF